jgi:hypothetical protein
MYVGGNGYYGMKHESDLFVLVSRLSWLWFEINWVFKERHGWNQEIGDKGSKSQHQKKMKGNFNSDFWKRNSYIPKALAISE